MQSNAKPEERLLLLKICSLAVQGLVFSISVKFRTWFAAKRFCAGMGSPLSDRPQRPTPQCLICALKTIVLRPQLTLPLRSLPEFSTFHILEHARINVICFGCYSKRFLYARRLLCPKIVL